ncbi:MAG: hypothetical protein JSV29_08890 [Candidatus Bathyarchaeota archaeon]|nr:MAG: hypothetical protein JSV29_08890 [Candidatus Bathyarchaeota archaeon]
MRLLIFTEGTLIMHRNGRGHTREEIVKQVSEGKDASLHRWKTYVPIGNAAEKLRTWKNQGLNVLYLTSRTEPTEVEDIKDVLKKHNFPEGQLLFRQEDEEYKNIVEKFTPDIMVEDDCESIGGKNEMTYTHIKPELKKRIKSIEVKEFSGIDHLPDDISEL